MKIKKYISVFLISALLFTAAPTAFAIEDQPGSSADNPIYTWVDEEVNLEDPRSNGSPSTNTGSDGDPPPTTEEDNSPYNEIIEDTHTFEKIGTLWGETHTSVTTSEKIINWLWASTGPGDMKMISPATPGFFGFVAGYQATVSFSAKGAYIVRSYPIRQKTIVTTVTRDEYDVFQDEGGFQSVSPTPRTVLVSKETVTEDPYVDMNNPRVFHIYADSLEPITIPGKNLTTTIGATFSRNYAYTQHCIDAKTNKPFELEVVFDITVNTKITSIGKPTQLITRYQNQGTMTISPVEYEILEGDVGTNHIKYRAKFVYPKASIPGKSTMTFPVTAWTLSGNYPLDPVIDVPVNTYNGRFTDLPDSERGKFYPIPYLVRNGNGYSIYTDKDTRVDKWGTQTWNVKISEDTVVWE
jgi:hypothetical protein